MEDELKNALTNLVKKSAYQTLTLRALVKTVDKSNRTCTIVLDNGTEIDKVLIQPIISYTKGVVIYPALNSKVIVEKIESQDMALRVVGYTAIESIETMIDTFLIKQDTNGLHVENQGEDLKTILNEYISKVDDFMTECSKIVVIVGNTINIGAVAAIQADVQAIKTRLNKVIC